MSDKNLMEQPQKIARGLKFRNLIVEELYYLLCSENKGSDQLYGYGAADMCLCCCVCTKQIFS